ncbi:MAG: hypothetical protein AB1696_16410 [Planctomycetota bacterium]
MKSGFAYAFVVASLTALPILYGQAKDVWRVTKCHAVENPTGMQFGFWANYHLMPEVLRDFGRQPIGRVAFTKWAMIEKEKGTYTWGNHFNDYELAHKCGSTVIANLNVIFSREVNPKATHAIPDFYPPRISRPETRQAAERFVYAYVQELLRRVGKVILVFDYELMWHYLPKTPAIRREYRDWYVAACGIARRAAADIGMADHLKLMPIVCGDPFTSAETLIGSPAEGHVPQQWLLDVVKASDYLGIDTYAYDPKDPSSPETTLRIIQFWKDHYSLGKPIYVPENGFSTVREVIPSFPQTGHHARGTEAEQREYFKNVLDELIRRNRPDGPLANQVRCFCIWMYKDQKAKGKEDQPLEHYFGLVRMDGSKKPAWHVVKDRMQKYADDPATRPSNIVSEEDVTERLASGEAVPMTYSTGTEFDFLHCEYLSPAEKERAVLSVETAREGELIVCVNGEHWLTTVGKYANPCRIAIGEHLKPDEQNTVDIWFTGAIFPFRQGAKRVRIDILPGTAP